VFIEFCDLPEGLKLMLPIIIYHNSMRFIGLNNYKIIAISNARSKVMTMIMCDDLIGT